MISILPHTHAFRCSRPGPASVYLASQTTVTGTVNTVRINYLGCALRTARLNDDCRPHPTAVGSLVGYEQSLLHTLFPTLTRGSLALVSLAHTTVTGHAPGDDLYSSAHARIQM